MNMIEGITLAVVSLAMTYLISELNQMQKDIRRLIMDVAILKAVNGISPQKAPDQ
jgi:hypothetical protein